MHAAIRRDEGAAAVAEALVRESRALAATVGAVPGFISHAVIETDDGALVSVCICEDAAGLAALDRLFDEWLAAHLPATPVAPHMTSGEVILQKGL